MSGFIDRPPRIQPELPIGEIEIPAPPRSEATQRQSLWQALVPLITIIGYVIVSATGRGSNVAFLLPMALAMFVSVGIALFTTLSNRRIALEKRRAYDQRLVEMRQEMTSAHDKQRIFYNYNYPDNETALHIDGAHADNRSGSRLWERRSYDADFGVLRLGMGTRESTVVYAVAEAENEENPQMREAERLARDSRFVADAPITIPLYQHATGSEKREPVQYALGIAGPPEQARSFMNALLVHFTAFHSPLDTQVFVLGTHQAAANWNWAADLPHCGAGKDSHLFFEDAAGKNPDKEKDGVTLYLKGIWTELDRRARRLRERDEKDDADVTLPFLLLVVDLLDTPAGNSTLKDVESEAAVSLLLDRGEQLGAAVIFLVPTRGKVISGCRAVIELTGKPAANFLYAEVGLNTPRYVGAADSIADTSRLTAFAKALAACEVRRSYGAELPRSVELLELYRSRTIDELHIPRNWQNSTAREAADWLEVAVGMVAGKEPRRLKFAADADGVHGMIAGSTGSGKSELLMTLILGLALKYDPSIVNFVLIDYKGGAAFDPFDGMPHVVDKVTNLGEGAVARMFAAINAELNRRQKMNIDNDCKHIVQYRQRGYHLREGGAYPHLLIIIDEFAEMIANNPEYKAQLESITRLGRSLGVTLILAAQRPSGVSDQMRANIKFRICLRVETREESNELLRRPDASYLPNGIPGRGYLQVGNDNLQEIQVAYTGADYVDSVSDMDPISRDIQRYLSTGVIWLDQLESNRETPKLFEVLVSRLRRIAEQEKRPPQQKPWPSPLPPYLALNDTGTLAREVDYALQSEMEYLRDEDREFLEAQMTDNAPLALNPSIAGWVNGTNRTWPDRLDWEIRAGHAVVGLIDDPANAQLRALRVNLQRGHVVMFGAAGWGKTTFLRSLITSLAATHSPRHLHLYMLDFGNQSLRVFEDLPHTGAYILSKEIERVQRLMRFLEQEIDQRKQILSDAKTNTLYTYNENHPDHPMPMIVVVIDNIAELKDNFENLLGVFTSLVREGLTTGVHFVVTGDQTNAIGKLFGLFPERLTLKLADSTEYSTIVGRGVRFVGDFPGRGFYAVGRSPLEFQIAVPVGVSQTERESGQDETRKLDGLVQTIADTWKGERPPQIGILPERAALRSLIEQIPSQPVPTVTLGLDDDSLAALPVNLQGKPHFAVTGPPASGKTTALYTWILALAYRCSPQEVSIVLVDRQGRLADYGGKKRLDDLPHVLQTVISEPEDMEELVENLKNEYSQPDHRRELHIIIDNYDDIGELAKSPVLKDLGNLGRRANQRGLHFVICGSRDFLRQADDLTRPTLNGTRFGLAMDAESAGVAPLSGRVPNTYAQMSLPPGRGFVVQNGRVGLLQVAAPYETDTRHADEMDAWVEEIIARGQPRSTWSQPLVKPEPETNGHNLPVVSTPAPDNRTVMDCLRRKLAEDMGVQTEMLKNITDDGIKEMATPRGITLENCEEAAQ